MRSTPYLRLITLAALGVLTLGLAAPAVYRLAARNLHAVSVMKAILANADASSIPNPAPRQRLWLARHALRRGDLPLAHRLLQGVDPASSPLARSAHAQLAWQQGDAPSAVAAWLQIGDYQSLRQAARQAETERKMEDAKVAYVSLAKVDPESYVRECAFFLAHRYNDYTAAIIILQDAINSATDQNYKVMWLQQLGELQREDRRIEESIATFEELLKIDPNNYSGLIGYGLTLYERGNSVDIALRVLKRAIEAKPQSAEAYYYFANVLSREKRYKEALPWFQVAIERNSESCYIQVGFANAIRASGNLKYADRLYNDLSKRFIDCASVYYEMAWNYYLLQDRDKAVVAIQQAINLQPINNKWFFLRAGIIYEWAGHLVEALQYYEQVIAIDANNQDAIRGIERLRAVINRNE